MKIRHQLKNQVRNYDPSNPSPKKAEEKEEGELLQKFIELENFLR